MIKSYKELIVWQKSIELVTLVYEITEQFPSKEIFGLTSQMRRAAISIASNIAEGRCRGTRKDFVQFLRIAFGSCAELETQILIAKNLKFLQKTDKISSLTEEIMKILSSMIKKLTANS